jgi:hypothetical protein
MVRELLFQCVHKANLAAAFSGTFSRALVSGLTVDEAVALGRAAMRAKALHGQRDIHDWGVSVFYSGCRADACFTR